MTRVVIRGHNLRRDTASNIVLACVLQARGCSAIITNAHNHLWMLERFQPHVVVENVHTQIPLTVNCVRGSAIVLSHSEGAVLPSQLGDREYVKQSDLYTAVVRWGEPQADDLRGILPERNNRKVVVVGNQRLDLIKYNRNLTPNPKISNSVGFMGRFADFHSTQYRGSALTKVTSELRVERMKGYLDIYYSMLSAMKDVYKNTNKEISYRPHPEEIPEKVHYLKKLFPKRFSIDTSWDVAEWISKQSMIIGTLSNTMTEAHILGVPYTVLDAGKNRGVIPRGSYEDLLDRTENKDELIEAFNSYRSIGSATNELATVIVNASTYANVPKSAYPAWLLELMYRRIYRNKVKEKPYLGGVLYCRGHHGRPQKYKTIANNILRECYHD